MQFQTIKVVCIKFYMAEASVIMGLMGQSEYVFCEEKCSVFYFSIFKKNIMLLYISANVELLRRLPVDKQR